MYVHVDIVLILYFLLYKLDQPIVY